MVSQRGKESAGCGGSSLTGRSAIGRFLCILVGGLGLAFFVAAPASAEFWGNLGVGGYPTGEKIAPNQLVYKPVFDLSADLNIGNRHGLYLFVDAAFYAERANAGVTTHSSQGDFDFTKRQFDLSGGLAYRFGSFEGRASAFSMNNLNRGTDPEISDGFKDGVALEGRWYYRESGDAYDDSQQYISAGYLLSNTLVDTAAQPYKPGIFACAKGIYALPTVPKLFGFASATLIMSRENNFKELQTEAGAGYKFRENLQLRASYQRDFGLQSDLPDRDRVLIELRYLFGWK